MPQVKWTGRDADGHLIDIVGDTAAMTSSPPGPAELEENGAGAGGVTVDNQSDPPAAVTTLIAPGADVSTPGEATIGTVLPITNEKTGLEDAEIQVLATAEDGDAALDLEVVSVNGAGLVEVTASGGDKAARVEVAASDALGSHFMVSFAEKIGFDGDPPVTRPVIPLTTPGVQDVIDALVALGLVTQSD